METRLLPPVGRRRLIFQIGVVLFVFSAMSASEAGSWRIVPQIGVSETYSTNMALVDDALARKGWITTITPALRVSGAGARVRGYLDFRHDESFYHGQSSYRTGRDTLSSWGTLEAIDNWLFVDAAAAVTPRSRSTFSPTTTDSSNAVGNQDDVRVAQISPSIRGRAFGATDYLMRLTSSDTRYGNERLADTKVNQLTGSLRNPGGSGSIGWFVDGTAVRVDSDAVGKRSDDRTRAGVILPVASHFHVLAFGGRESTDFATGANETLSTPGIGFEWRPSEHTQATGQREKRFFGYGHDLTVTHRTLFTAWRYSDVKDAAVLPAGMSWFSRGSIYDLMYDLVTASITDPVARDEAARARADQVGPVGGILDASGILVSRVFLDRTRRASVALVGSRSVITLVFQQRDQQLLGGSQPNIQDDFTLSPEIRDRSAFVSWIHRLTPVATLNLSLVHLRREGMSVPDVESTQRSGGAALSVSLNQKATGTVAVRATNFSTIAGQAIHERAVVGTLTQRF